MLENTKKLMVHLGAHADLASTVKNHILGVFCILPQKWVKNDQNLKENQIFIKFDIRF